jgi:hypothetical protein
MLQFDRKLLDASRATSELPSSRAHIATRKPWQAWRSRDLNIALEGTNDGVADWSVPPRRGQSMNMKFIAAAAFVVALATPAFAANEFYLVQDTGTKKCSIVEVKPTISTMTVVGAVHKTKMEAETALKADKSCVTL